MALDVALNTVRMSHFQVLVANHLLTNLIFFFTLYKKCESNPSDVHLCLGIVLFLTSDVIFRHICLNQPQNKYSDFRWKDLGTFGGFV